MYSEVMLGGGHINADMQQFLEMDRKVLRFHCIMDDLSTPQFERRPFQILFFLADDQAAKMINFLIARWKEEANEEAEHKGWYDTDLSTNERIRKERASLRYLLHGGRTVTTTGFSVSGVGCAAGHAGTVAYTQCSGADSDYTLGGCEASCNVPATQDFLSSAFLPRFGIQEYIH